MPFDRSNNFQYAVDIVFCIDVTGSMGPVLEEVKAGALSLHPRLLQMMESSGKSISQLRVRVVVFRDFAHRAADAIETTEFLTLPDQLAEFEHFVKRQVPTGGGDEPESALEALAVAINSDWERGLDRRRHVVVMFTDASAHPIGMPSAMAAATYPGGIPTTDDDLYEAWGYAGSQESVMETSAKRLLLFVPDTTPWNTIASEWTHTIFLPSRAGEGLEEWELTEILNVIANSV